MNIIWVIFLVLTVKVHAKSLVKRSPEDEAVAPPNSYLPSVEYEEDLPGYNSVDAYAGAGEDLPGYDPSGETTTAAGDTDETTTEAVTTEGLPGYEPSEDVTTDDTTTEAMETTTDLIRYNAGVDDLNEEATTEPSTTDEEDATSATPEEDDENPGDTSADQSGGTSDAFKTYSSLSPTITICPGGSVEACVGVCPGSSPRVYGACVQGCADRCGEQP